MGRVNFLTMKTYVWKQKGHLRFEGKKTYTRRLTLSPTLMNTWASMTKQSKLSRKQNIQPGTGFLGQNTKSNKNQAAL